MNVLPLEIQGAPIIGNNIFSTSDCEVIGEISIADCCVVEVNAVVVNNIEESGITVTGVPAQKARSNNFKRLVFWFNSGNLSRISLYK